MRPIKLLIAWLVLRPLVKRNYRLRREGKLPDEWYWADTYLIEWGSKNIYRGM